MKKTILSIFGTRPEAIKMVSVVNELKKHHDIESYTCVTAQHREMLDTVLDAFSLEPHFDLNVMAPNQSLTAVTSRILSGLDDVLERVKPDVVLVQGDTATCFAGALAAFNRNIAVGHIEAGLRTGDLNKPFPEEGNRQMVSRIATYHFAPTEYSAAALKREILPCPNIFVTGNTVIDALHMAQDVIMAYPERARLEGCNELDVLANDKYILVTGHRRESFGQGFLNICHALRDIAIDYTHMNIIYPVHLNPQVQKPVNEILQGISNVLLIPPQPYLAFIRLLSGCHFVLTDSGGIQEEGPALGKPVLVMRETTERPEGVDAGTCLLVGTARDSIVNHVKKLITDATIYEKMATTANPYGDGKAAMRICEILMNKA